MWMLEEKKKRKKFHRNFTKFHTHSEISSFSEAQRSLQNVPRWAKSNYSEDSSGEGDLDLLSELDPSDEKCKMDILLKNYFKTTSEDQNELIAVCQFCTVHNVFRTNHQNTATFVRHLKVCFEYKICVFLLNIPGILQNIPINIFCFQMVHPREYSQYQNELRNTEFMAPYPVEKDHSNASSNGTKSNNGNSGNKNSNGAKSNGTISTDGCPNDERSNAGSGYNGNTHGSTPNFSSIKSDESKIHENCE